jgi:predicted metal-dependent phosphoesterase TrpH
VAVPARRHDPGVSWGLREPHPPSTIDLHTHTLRSDGLLTPAELVSAAFDVGVRTLAITDHDTLAGFREVVAGGSIPSAMTLLAGVEINALVPRNAGLLDGELHVLGFGMAPDDAAFEAALVAQRGHRRLRFERTVDRLRELGLGIDAQVEGILAAEPGASSDDALGRPTIARALMAAGHATSVEDAFARLIGYGGPAYVRREGLGPVEAIAAIREARGTPVLAHFREAPEQIRVLSELKEAGLAGLEVYYRTFDEATVAAVRVVADELGLLATGGSDYHGDTETYAEAHAALSIPESVATNLVASISAYHSGP